MPPENISDSGSKNKAVYALIAVFALLLLVVFVMQSSNNKKVEQANQNTKENVKVKNVDLASAVSPESRLPEGFPRDIPVEFGEIVESYTADYVDRGLVQYVVSFLSSKTADEKYDEYDTFMTGAGFTFGPTAKDPESRSLYGRKDNDDLSVAIGLTNGRTLVQLTYLDRK